VHPGVTPEQVQQQTGFRLAVAPDLAETPPPSREAVRLVREVLDPHSLRDGILTE